MRAELKFGDAGFCGERKTGEPGEKPSEQHENQQQTQPAYDAWSGNRTRDTLMGGERSHHCAICTDRPGTQMVSASLGGPVYHNLKTNVLFTYESYESSSSIYLCVCVCVCVCVCAVLDR